MPRTAHAGEDGGGGGGSGSGALRPNRAGVPMSPSPSPLLLPTAAAGSAPGLLYSVRGGILALLTAAPVTLLVLRGVPSVAVTARPPARKCL